MSKQLYFHSLIRTLTVVTLQLTLQRSMEACPPPWKTFLNAFPDWLNTEHETIDKVVASDRSAVFKITARWQTGNNAPP